MSTLLMFCPTRAGCGVRCLRFVGPSIFNVRAGAVNNKLWFAIREGSWQSATMGAFERRFGGRRDSWPRGWMRGAQRLQAKAGDEVARMPFTEKMPGGGLHCRS